MKDLVIIRFLPEDPWEWDQACIQFQSGGKVKAGRCAELLRDTNNEVKRRNSLVYTKAKDREIMDVLIIMGYSGKQIINVED